MATDLSQDLLAALIRYTFGAKAEIVEQRIANQHPDYVVLIAQLRHPTMQVVIKLAGPESPMASAFDRTAMLHRRVAESTSIPMPETLAVGMDFGKWPWRYFIRKHTAGEEWVTARRQMSAAEQELAYAQIGDAAAQLHTIYFPHWGKVLPDGNVQGSSSFLEALTEHARQIITAPHSRNLFLAVLEENQDLFQDRPAACLCHEDLHQHNILFQRRGGEWRLAAILDFDKAWAGDHESDLARLEFWTGMTAPAFWPAYLAVHPVDPGYARRRPIYQLLWCFEFARPTAAHLEDTQRLCAQLGFPDFERFD